MRETLVSPQRNDSMKPGLNSSRMQPMIRQSTLQALAEQSRIVRLPLNKIGSINKINKAFARLEQEFERPPTAAELAETDMTLMRSA